jgi:uncharacterized protein
MISKNDLIERRFVTTNETKINVDKRTLEGYAAIFNSDSLPIGGMFTERIHKGAFVKTISESDIICSRDHEDGKILGRISSGTLRLSEDTRGLYYSCSLPDTTYANDLKESISRGDVKGNSFEFNTIKDKWAYPTEKNGTALRDVFEVRLFQVGPVTVPAYEKTSLTLRSGETEIDFEKFQFLLLKCSRNLSLDNEERAFVKGIFDRFSLETEPEPREHSEIEPVSNHSTTNEPDDTSTQARIEERRRLNNIILGEHNG